MLVDRGGQGDGSPVSTIPPSRQKNRPLVCLNSKNNLDFEFRHVLFWHDKGLLQLMALS